MSQILETKEEETKQIKASVMPFEEWATTIWRLKWGFANGSDFVTFEKTVFLKIGISSFLTSHSLNSVQLLC